MFVVSFVILIFIGTVLLTLPISAKSGRFTNLWTRFSRRPPPRVSRAFPCMTRLHTGRISGRAFCLCSFSAAASALPRLQRVSRCSSAAASAFAYLVLARESAGGSNLDVISLLRIVVAFTFVVEALGALLLMVRFVPLYGGLGAWASVFVSVSAFCNAGFDILSFIPAIRVYRPLTATRSSR